MEKVGAAAATNFASINNNMVRTNNTISDLQLLCHFAHVCRLDQEQHEYQTFLGDDCILLISSVFRSVCGSLHHD